MQSGYEGRIIKSGRRDRHDPQQRRRLEAGIDYERLRVLRRALGAAVDEKVQTLGGDEAQALAALRRLSPAFWDVAIYTHRWYIAYSLTGQTANETVVDPWSGEILAEAGDEIDFDRAYQIVCALGYTASRATEWAAHWHFPTGCECPECGSDSGMIQPDARYDLWCAACKRGYDVVPAGCECPGCGTWSVGS